MIKLLLVLWWWFRTGGLTQMAEEERYRRRLQLPARRLDVGETEMSRGNNDTGEATAVLEPPLEARSDLVDTPPEPLLTDEVPQRVIDVVINLRLAYEENGIYAIRVVGLDSQHPQLNAAEAAKLGFLLDNASKVVASVRTAAGFSA